LGTRMAGKLLRAMGSAEATFNPSLPELQSHRLPASVAQTIRTRQPTNAANRLAQAAGIRLLTLDEPQYPHAFARFTTPDPPVSSWKN
jgi:predicted Rossmann fold nucleotide-binding protein DprA/Smf involved in DNA uptake